MGQLNQQIAEHLNDMIPLNGQKSFFMRKY